MQKFWNVIALVFCLFTAMDVMAAGEEAKCRQWALEDGVPSAKLAAYVRECAVEISSASSEASQDFSALPSPAPTEENRQTFSATPLEN